MKINKREKKYFMKRNTERKKKSSKCKTKKKKRRLNKKIMNCLPINLKNQSAPIDQP